MVVTRREQLAWAAGFFDGEGYIGCRDRTGEGHLVKYRSPRTIVLTVTQNHVFVLNRFPRIFGFGRVYRMEAKHLYKDGRTTSIRYGWRVGKFEHVQAAVAMMWPFLGQVKRQQAYNALKLYHDVGRRKKLDVAKRYYYYYDDDSKKEKVDGN